MALVLACGLALAAPSLANDNPPTTTGKVQPRQVDWHQLGQGEPLYRSRTSNRIYYARTSAATRPWKSVLSSADRGVLARINFNRYGVLVVFLTARYEFTLDGVFVGGPDALRVEIGLPDHPPSPPSSCEPNCPGIVLPYPPTPYLLITVRKGSLPGEVHELYLDDAGDP